MTLIKPLSDYVLIKPVTVSDTTKGGLYIPETAQEKPMKGTILAVGPDITDTLVLEDIVYYKQYAAEHIKVNDEALILIRKDGIIAKESN